MATQPQVTSGGSRQPLLVAALAGVLVLVFGLLVLRPLLSGGTDEAATPPAVTAAAAPATTPQLINPSTTVAPSGAATGSVKDPFRPLVTAGTAAATGGAGVTPAPGAGTAVGSPTATTIAAVQPTVPGAGAGTATTPGGGAAAERKVTLVNVANGKAKVSVDGASYTVEEGESFAGDYRAVDINSQCATFESGTTPFTLCEGEAVLK
jgi:hypothetical protein